jgi:hypothetical protein
VTPPLTREWTREDVLTALFELLDPDRGAMR